MTPFLAALIGAVFALGLIGIVAGFQPPLAKQLPGAPPSRRVPFAARLARASRRTRILLAVGVTAGILITLFTGWVVALVVVPAAVVGLPTLLSVPSSNRQIKKLEALNEWTRSLSGLLTSGSALEAALTASLRSTPDEIRPEVTRLVARLRARMSSEAALRLFADDLDDAAGDVVACYLILGVRRRGQGLASILENLSDSLATEIRGRRAVEADRGKPRGAARWTTIITVSVLVVLTFTGSYIAPYGSPIGQILLAALLTAYVALLLWLRQMSAVKPVPRYLGATARAGARA